MLSYLDYAHTNGGRLKIRGWERDSRQDSAHDQFDRVLDCSWRGAGDFDKFSRCRATPISSAHHSVVATCTSRRASLTGRDQKCLGGLLIAPRFELRVRAALDFREQPLDDGCPLAVILIRETRLAPSGTSCQIQRSDFPNLAWAANPVRRGLLYLATRTMSPAFALSLDLAGAISLMSRAKDVPTSISEISHLPHAFRSARSLITTPPFGTCYSRCISPIAQLQIAVIL